MISFVEYNSQATQKPFYTQSISIISGSNSVTIAAQYGKEPATCVWINTSKTTLAISDLTWTSTYVSSSNGYEVDVTFTSSGGDTRAAILVEYAGVNKLYNSGSFVNSVTLNNSVIWTARREMQFTQDGGSAVDFKLFKITSNRTIAQMAQKDPVFNNLSSGYISMSAGNTWRNLYVGDQVSYSNNSTNYLPRIAESTSSFAYPYSNAIAVPPWTTQYITVSKDMFDNGILYYRALKNIDLSIQKTNGGVGAYGVEVTITCTKTTIEPVSDFPIYIDWEYADSSENAEEGTYTAKISLPTAANRSTSFTYSISSSAGLTDWYFRVYIRSDVTASSNYWPNEVELHS